MPALGPFTGIDARPGAADLPGGLLDALNVIMGADGSAVRRPALVVRATLPADSHGLYSVGDQLRTTATYQIAFSTTSTGSNVQGATTINVGSTVGFPTSGFFTLIDTGAVREYAYSGKTGTAFTGLTPPLIVDVTAGASVRYDDCAQDNGLRPTISVDYISDTAPKVFTDVLGTVIGSDGRALTLIKHSDGSTALHRAAVSALPPLTLTEVTGLLFTPNFSLVRAAGRAFVLDADQRYLRYSNLDSNSPDSLVDFLSNADQTSGSGFQVVSQFASGAGSPQGLCLFGGRIVVLYRSALLIYRIDADQSRFFLEQQITGPGTAHPRTATELGADTIFLSDAGVRALSTVVQTLDAREDAIGGRIDHLAKKFGADVTIRPVGCYARRLGCYLLAFGQDVLCLGILPGSAVLGWTRWRLPVAVDAWAESAGLLWVRSGTTLYAMDDAEDQDEVSLGVFASVPVLVETLPKRGTQQVTATSVAASSVEPVRVQVIADGRPAVDSSGAPIGMAITLPPRSPEPAWALVGKLGRTFSVRVYDEAATSGWRLDNLWLETA
jgi:hypothetical protein